MNAEDIAAFLQLNFHHPELLMMLLRCNLKHFVYLMNGRPGHADERYYPLVVFEIRKMYRKTPNSQWITPVHGIPSYWDWDQQRATLLATRDTEILLNILWDPVFRYDFATRGYLQQALDRNFVDPQVVSACTV